MMFISKSNILVLLLSTMLVLVGNIIDFQPSRVLRLTVLIDAHNEIEQNGAIGDDLKHLIAQQAAPIMVIGGHLFEHVIEGYNHCKQGVWRFQNTKRYGLSLRPLINQTKALRQQLSAYNGYAKWYNNQLIRASYNSLQTSFDDIVAMAEKSKEDESFKDDASSYFALSKVGITDGLQSFDQNWLMYRFVQSNDQTLAYLLIPRRYIEYAFNIAIRCLPDQNLYDAIHCLCVNKQVLDNQGLICDNVDDVLRELGFNLKKTIQNILTTVQRVNLEGIVHEHGDTVSGLSDTIAKQSEIKGISKEKIFLITESIINNVVLTVKRPDVWCLRTCGHGVSMSGDGSSGKICGLRTDDFVHFLKNVMSPKGLGLMSISSCYAGGIVRTELESIAEELKQEGQPCFFVVESATDAQTIELSPSFINPADNSVLFDAIESFADAKKFSCWNALPFVSIARNDDFFEKAELFLRHKMMQSAYRHGKRKRMREETAEIAEHSVSKKRATQQRLDDLEKAYASFVMDKTINSESGTYDVIPSNFPLVLDPGQATTFEPLYCSQNSCIITGQEDAKDLYVTNKSVLWVTPEHIKSKVKLCGTVPWVISTSVGQIEHCFEKIDARECGKEIDALDVFAGLFFVCDDYRPASIRDFVIKKLILPSGVKYHNVFARQQEDVIIAYSPECNEPLVYKANEEDLCWDPCSIKELPYQQKKDVKKWLGDIQLRCQVETHPDEGTHLS
jgi:hypothetical protein